MAARKYSVAGPGLVKVDIEVKDVDKVVPHSYVVPGTVNAAGEIVGGQAFMDWLKGSTVVGEGETKKTVPNVEIAFDRFCYATDLKERASKREAVATESSVIKRDGKEIDLMALAPNKAVAAVNAAFGLVAITGGDPQNAFKVTRRKLIESGVATENKDNGMLVLAKK